MFKNFIFSCLGGVGWCGTRESTLSFALSRHLVTILVPAWLNAILTIVELDWVLSVPVSRHPFIQNVPCEWKAIFVISALIKDKIKTKFLHKTKRHFLKKISDACSHQHLLSFMQKYFWEASFAYSGLSTKFHPDRKGPLCCHQPCGCVLCPSTLTLNFLFAFVFLLNFPTYFFIY